MIFYYVKCEWNFKLSMMYGTAQTQHRLARVQAIKNSLIKGRGTHFASSIHLELNRMNTCEQNECHALYLTSF